jgi:hypothetical protein
MTTDLQIKISADIADLKASLASAQTQLNALGDTATKSSAKASAGFAGTQFKAKELDASLAQAYKTLGVVPDALITERIGNIQKAYDDLAKSGTASEAELARANQAMAQQIARLEDYQANGTASDTDPQQAEQAANAAADAVHSAMESIKAEIGQVFSSLGTAAKEHIGGTAALAAFAMSRLKIGVLDAGSSFLGGFADPAAKAAASVLEKLAGLARQLALLAGAFALLKASAGLWSDALSGTLDSQSKKLLETIDKLRTLQSEMAASTVQQAQLLQRVGDATGVSQGTLSAANGLRSKLADQPEVAGQFGISGRDLKGKDALGDADLYTKAATALKSYTEGLDRNNAAKALGITNTAEFLRFTEQFSAELDNQKQRLSDLSLTFSDEYIKELEDADATMRRVRQSNDDMFGALRTAWSDATRPVVVDLANMFSDVMPAAIMVARAAITALFAVFRTGGAIVVSGMITVEQIILGAGDALVTFGNVARKVFALDFAGAAAAFGAGIDQVKNRAIFAGQQIAAQFQDVAKKLENIVDGPARGKAVDSAKPQGGLSYTPPKPAAPTTTAKSGGAGGQDIEKQLADAKFALAKASLEAEQKLLEDALKTSLAAYDSAYKDGLVSLDGYYTAREAIERDRLAGILRIRQSELAAGKAREAEATKRKDLPGQLRAQADVVKLDAEVKLAQGGLDKLASQIEQAKLTDQKLLQALTLKVNMELAQLQGITLDRPTIEADLREQMKDLLTKFATDPVMSAKLEKIITLKADESQYKTRLEQIDRESKTKQQPLDGQAALVNARQQNGSVSQPRAQQQLEGIRAQQSSNTQEQIKKLQAERDMLGDITESAAKADKALDLDARINTLRVNLESLKPAAMDLGVEFENSLQRNSEAAFDSIINGTKSASQAFGDMAKAIIADIAKMIIKLLVMKAVKALVGGFSDGGEVGGGAQAFADGGGVHGPGGPRDDVIPAWLSNGEHVMDVKTVGAFGGHGFFNAMRAIGQGKGGPAAASRIMDSIAGLGLSVANLATPANPRALRLADGGAVPSIAAAQSQAMQITQNFHVSGNADQRTQSQVGAAAFNGARRATMRNS